MVEPAGSMSDGAVDLQAGFAAFVAAAQGLERSYQQLRARAEAVDLELQATNEALQRMLQEREAVFAALPLGLIAVRRDGATAFGNAEGERLAALLDRAGIPAATAEPGEVAVAGGLVRVRRVALADGGLVLLEDRSRIHELEQQVHRLDRLAGLSELALGIAHEIKNPLNGVMGFAELLDRSEDPAAARRFAARITAGLRQIDAIVTALLGFARPTRDRVATATVASIVADAAAAAGLPQGRVRLSGVADQVAEAQGLLRVLANLMANAREAGGDRIQVRIHAAVVCGRLELLVEDDGPGVPADLGQRVFEPFVSSKERGTGLGLPLCVRVLAYLGGDLTLLNPGEPGARFRVRLPLSTPAARAATVSEASA